MTDLFTQNLIDVCKQAGLRFNNTTRKHSEKPWFNEQCNIEKENLKSLGRHISRNPNVEELNLRLHKKKKAFKHLCRKKKRQHYNRIIKCIDLSNAKTAWRQLRKLFNLGKSKNMQKKYI